MSDFKKCSHCGCITDFDERVCPKCSSSSFRKERVPLREVLSQIASGEITISAIMTKRPAMITG